MFFTKSPLYINVKEILFAEKSLNMSSFKAHKIPNKRLSKCFCSCSNLSEDEVYRISQLSVQATLIDNQALQIFKRFLQKNRFMDNKSLTEQYLDIYEQCTIYMLNENKILTLDELDKLSNLGLAYLLESDLRNQIRTGDCDNIKRCLLRIQGECRKEIEISKEYEAYKNAITQKL